ncbi:RTA1-domain-containing protein [Panus rudis PR-1116 ss-1]|nr:RTA1-domain-containing protein [Panus rudis PR-1116 ss-1]
MVSSPEVTFPSTPALCACLSLTLLMVALDLDSPYNYVPTEWICALFVTLFGLSCRKYYMHYRFPYKLAEGVGVVSVIHLTQALYYRLWWLIPTACLATVAELIGWSARLWSSKNPPLVTPYLMQITTTIIAPTPLIAANFIILGRLINGLGSCYSRLSSKWYLIVFTSCDLIALVVQAVGGAQASVAANDKKDPTQGGNVMLGGIAFQLVAVVMYMVLASEFVLRFLYNRPLREAPRGKNNVPHSWDALDWRIQLAFISLAFSGVCLLIRSIYRTIELADGWFGTIISTQIYFNVLDGAMIVLATYTMNIFHPGILLRGLNASSGDSDISLHAHQGDRGNRDNNGLV